MGKKPPVLRPAEVMVILDRLGSCGFANAVHISSIDIPMGAQPRFHIMVVAIYPQYFSARSQKISA